MAILRLIGHWREERADLDPGWNLSAEDAAKYESLRQQALGWPDPKALVDPKWPVDERRVVVEYLRTGTLLTKFRGLSPCRFCGCDNGSAEFSDGSFSWPEGLAHYLDVHGVRLPEEFVEHVITSSATRPWLPPPTFDHLGQRDRLWPGAGFEAFQPMSDNGADVERDLTWWHQQAKLIRGQGGRELP